MDQREFVLQKIDALLNEHSSHYSENSVAILDDLFDAIEKCKSSFSSIHAAPHLTGLVKMRGIIQNGAEAEYVHFAYRRADSPSLTTPLLRDDFDETLTIQAQEESGRLLARHCFRVVEVPGASDWYVDEFEVNDISSAKKSRKTDGAQPIQLLSKFYGDAAENLKPNQVVDIYGLLTNEKSDDRNAAVLHVIKYSLVTPNDLAKGFNLSKNDMHCTLVVLQKNLEHILGDSSSASFLLANILSSTYSRPGGMPICSIPVNVQGISDSAPIISFLKNVLPTVKTLELSPDFLSTAAFASFKDYDTDRLVQGELQLASGTLVVIDETKLPEGSFPVSKHAETNLKTLEQLILEQRINYDYGFYKLPFDVDYPILILSKGKTSRILKTPFTVPFVPNVTGADVPPLNESTALTIARKYIQCVRSNLRNISITAETTKMINESFIEIAKKLDKNIDKADFLNETLILSRIFAASEGDSFVTDKHWNMAISLENSRNEAMRMFSSMQNS